MVLDVDQNDNGMIEFNEFLQMMSKKMREGDCEDEVRINNIIKLLKHV